ncbi:MAG: hypothetical protein A2289_05845 [Deltaproteobacteria bacterium RIFOXYA12_FULL_58_15]|nr:MAG: hypothetical protein A2289_05845 [Deltaproteobacteria bacterium RIFOXYA12_FULL_58_15]OGR07926.1 MAG: hypothetical protein A2341_19365 [Deltaproteobacteria bacterium RIFOXYB12_FULL_58_9]
MRGKDISLRLATTTFTATMTAPRTAASPTYGTNGLNTNTRRKMASMNRVMAERGTNARRNEVGELVTAGPLTSSQWSA